MLRFLSRVRIEFNPLDARTACCMEFLAQCTAAARHGKPPGCQVLVKRRTDDCTPRIALTYIDGAEEVVDAASTYAQALRDRILDKGQVLETEKMFREAGEPWPVLISEKELRWASPPGAKAFDRAAGQDGRRPPGRPRKSRGGGQASTQLTNSQAEGGTAMGSQSTVGDLHSLSQASSLRGRGRMVAVRKF